MKSIYIVTTNWGTHDMTKSFVDRLLGLQGIENIEIIVVNNSSEENILFNNWKKKENIQIINTNKNLGYAGGINEGLEIALKDSEMKAVLVTNNDVEFSDTLIKDFLKEDYKNNILSPLILLKDTDIIQNTGGRISYLLGGTINVNKNVSLEKYKKKKYDFLSGCMLFLSKEILENVGLFDPDYIAYYEDVDYCLRAKKRKYGLKIIKGIQIRHFHSASTFGKHGFKKYLLTRNSIIFARKNLKFPGKQIFILMSLIRGFIQNLKYLRFYIKGIKEGFTC